MRRRLDVRVDPERDLDRLFELARDPVDIDELGPGFHIKKEDPGPDRRRRHHRRQDGDRSDPGPGRHLVSAATQRDDGPAELPIEAEAMIRPIILPLSISSTIMFPAPWAQDASRRIARPARVLVQRIVIGMSQIWNGSSSGNESLLLAAGVDLGGESIEGCA